MTAIARFLRPAARFSKAGRAVPLATCILALSVPALTMFGAAASGAEIRVLSAAAMQSVFKGTMGDFERASGHKLVISYDTIGGIMKRLRDGEVHDLVIGSSLIMPSLANEGKIDARSLTGICRTAIGGVVPARTPRPAFASIDDFKRALLSAKFVVYADPARGGAAGVHIGRQIDRLGLAEQLKPKTRLAAGGDVTEVTLALGEGALGLTQVSEIVQKEGAEFIGPLPDELQNHTVFVAGIPSTKAPSEAVAAFISFLQSPRVVEVIKAKGMQPEPLDRSSHD